MIETTTRSGKNYIFRLGFVFFFVTGILLIFVSSCGDYKTCVFRNALDSCSFEYPAEYSRPGIDRENGFSRASFKRILEQPVSIITLTVQVRIKDRIYSDIQALRDYSLGSIQDNQKPGDFRLIEETTFSIDGAQGNQITYTYYAPKSDPNDPGSFISVQDYAIEAFFEHKGILWDIHSNSHPAIPDVVEVGFEHVIQTFKFLD